jgi:hypothetical protein
MVQLRQLLHLDDGEFPALRAEIESKPTPAPPVQKPPNWGRDMIAFLRSEAPVEPRTLGIRRPAAPKQRPANPFAWQTATAALVHTLAVAYDDIADELETALAELAVLAPFIAKAGC